MAQGGEWGRSASVNGRQDRTGGLIAGGILIALGVVFLLRDRIDLDWGLVWPFFLIVPGAFVLVRALFVNDHRDRTGGFIGGAILVFLGGVFLFQNFYDLDWSKIWPFFLIIPGVGLLLGAFLGWGRREHRESAQAGWAQQQAPPAQTPPPVWAAPPDAPPQQAPAVATSLPPTPPPDAPPPTA
jgi:uncharacterized membrane protein HdeD (DUF308 family)